MENIIQGSISRGATEAVGQISQRDDDSSLAWSHDNPMAAFIDTYACIGLGGFGSPFTARKGGMR